MPTVILLDTSLSMIRSVPGGDNGDTPTTMLQLAIHGITQFLDYLAANEKLEFVSLITFSSLFEVPVNFTRDFEYIKSKLSKLEEGDEAHIDIGIVGVAKLVLAEWGPSTECNVVIFTDGSPAHFNVQPPPYAFNGKFHIISVSTPSSAALAYFHRVVEISSNLPGSVITPEPGPVTISTINTMVKKLAESVYSTYAGLLKCGHLSARIGLYPAPQPYLVGTEKSRAFSDTLDIYGFIDFTNLASPMAISRHLVTPLPNNKTEAKIKGEADVDDVELDEAKLPSFCVLLHGALKVENVAALCTVGDDWFAILYSWADNKKKSNLMLTVLEPGRDSVPWLGDLNYLGVLEEYPPLLVPPSAEPPSFPVCPVEKRSYSQNTVVWIRRAGLQSDIQKILRHSRKLPEKTQHFYKELNRLRKAAVCFGFVELLNGLAEILDRECSSLPAGTHPDCAMQLQHAAEVLRRPISRDPNYIISPLKTRFQTDSD